MLQNTLLGSSMKHIFHFVPLCNGHVCEHQHHAARKFQSLKTGMSTISILVYWPHAPAPELERIQVRPGYFVVDMRRQLGSLWDLNLANHLVVLVLPHLLHTFSFACLAVPKTARIRHFQCQILVFHVPFSDVSVGVEGGWGHVVHTNFGTARGWQQWLQRCERECWS